MENPMSRLRQVAIERRETEAVTSERGYQEASKKRLLKIIEKKLNTSFIGALSKFETCFGQLWGHGKDEMDCTDEELRNREIWNLCRTDVLNNGNNQLRSVQAEILQYTIEWQRHTLNIAVPKPKESL
jgi:hypothetical protein